MCPAQTIAQALEFGQVLGMIDRTDLFQEYTFVQEGNQDDTFPGIAFAIGIDEEIGWIVRLQGTQRIHHQIGIRRG